MDSEMTGRKAWKPVMWPEVSKTRATLKWSMRRDWFQRSHYILEHLDSLNTCLLSASYEHWDRLLTSEIVGRGVDFLQLRRMRVYDRQDSKMALCPLHALSNPLPLRVRGTSASDCMIMSLIS